MAVPDATENPDVAPVAELSHEYPYTPFPPVGVAPLNADGVTPEQIVCAALIVLPAITGFTVTATAAEVSIQPPELTTLLYQVLAVNADGE